MFVDFHDLYRCKSVDAFNDIFYRYSYYFYTLSLYKVAVLFQDGLNTSGETDNDIPKFITDSNEKTSYVRGKFLGKVSRWLDICIPSLTCLWRCPCWGLV